METSEVSVSRYYVVDQLCMAIGILYIVYHVLWLNTVMQVFL